MFTNKSFWLSMLPFAANIVGMELKNRDANATGKDDRTGDLCIAFGNAFAAAQSSSENAYYKSVQAVRAACDQILSERTVS